MTSVAILAGGLATRIRPLTENFPKALIDINGRPFIDYQVRLLKNQGFTDLVMCVGFGARQIEEHLGDGERLGVSVRYSSDGKDLIGTGGALRNALPLLSDPFFVTYGDAYLRADYQAILSYFYEEKTHIPPPLGLMAVFENLGQFDKSNVVFDDGRILVYDKVQKLPEMRHIDWGVGVLNHAAFQKAPSELRFDLATLYMTLVSEGLLTGYEVSERFYQIGSFEGIESFRKLGISLD